jgi:GNAT superfamily N-acetyltransferase
LVGTALGLYVGLTLSTFGSWKTFKLNTLWTEFYMYIAELFEAKALKTLVILPGGFHPFHPGHLSLYKSAAKAFPGADIYYAATNDKSERPFDITDKARLAQIAGVPEGHFVQVKSPFQAREITQNYDPNTTVLVFARSEKDRNEPPQAGGVKKNGEPSYLQPYTKGDLAPMSQHGYMVYLPTVQFDAGPSGVTSATQIRTMWPRADDAQKQDIVNDLYPRNPQVAKQILDKNLGGGLAEGLLDKFVKPKMKFNIETAGEELYVDVTLGGKQVAGFTFDMLGDDLEAQDMSVSPEYRGQGIAQTVYDMLKAKGFRINRSQHQTDAGSHFWDKNKGAGSKVWEQGVAEGFDQPYPLKWEKSEYGDIDALARLPDGTPLSIMFNLADMSENDWGVEFHRNNSQSVTGEGDAQRVFATVLNAIGQFIKKKKPDTLFFTSVKEEDPKGSRTKLYDRLVQRYATGLGYDLQKVDYPGQTGYKLIRKEQGVAEETVDEHIGKVKGGYRLYSHTGKNLGTFPSKAGAEKHEREVEYFKHRDSVKESTPVDPSVVQMKKRARMAHPFAKSDEEALALYINDREIRDVNNLEHEDDDIESDLAQIHRQLDRLAESAGILK